MNPFPESWHVLVETLAGCEASWQTPEEVAAAMREPVDATTDLLATLHVEGLLDVWERDDGVFVALSPLGASVAKLRIVERGLRQVPTWGRVGDPLPPLPRARGVAASVRGANLETVTDPRPIVANDRHAKDKAPSLLIGLGTTPWPNASAAANPVCPICGSRKLPSHAYCLYCDRWGGDPAEPDRLNPDDPRPVPHPAPPRDLSADERAAREARKAKRQRRMSQRVHDARKPQAARNSGRR